MVSRFPNGSPFNSNSQNRIVATFNRDFTRDELLGKLSCIMYDSSDGEFLLTTKPSQPEDETIVRLSTSTVGPELDLQIEGNNLVVSDEFSDGWLFDIDFDGQHKKFFEKTSAVYLMQLPNIIATSNTPKYAIAQVTNNLDASAALTVNLAINDSSYQPIAADAELTDIDVNDWFNNESESANFDRIARLVKLILQMEYFLPESVTINVGNDYQETWTVDGGLWNLFTDGSEYIPLVMTSRFPNGSPVKTNGILATFNRTPYSFELAGKTKVVARSQTRGVFASTMAISDGQLFISGPKDNSLIYIDNNSIKLTEDTSDNILYDIDFKEQHQRPLTLPSSETPLMFECANPDILGVGGDKLDLFIINNSGDLEIKVVTNSGGTEVMGSNGQLPPRSYQGTPSTVLTLLNNILEMEFSNYDDFTTDTEIYTDEPISGTVDLLTVSTVTPA